ncbi:hypothetical protein C8A00DRAFT_44554 [Chaetomidium leptoderma]|uniref:Uncharacterized protein n=1 Tax=Chaetomidium leptoderma TaxID=669021 RepID=A0AAN6VJG8_9PEZI|nr:hypothetical protein C8A00DRAFT_44554 [Chaetomidium leptoderma]
MDASLRIRRQRRGRGRQRLPNLALIASLFLHPSHMASASAAAVGSQLHRRIQGEHVVLADCRDKADVVSSQMAYFVNEPGPTPKDVAVLVTAAGQAALWVNTNTTGLFFDTGVSFTAILGPRVEDGQFAGIGYNDYGNFTCYQRYATPLYTYDTTTCSQVYMCDHSDPPPGGFTQVSDSPSGMSQGTIIGIAVGVVGGLLFLTAAAVVFWYLRRSRRGHQAAPSRHSGEIGSAGTGTGTLSPGPGSETGENKAEVQGLEMHAAPEMDGRVFRRLEMGNDTGKFELDASGHGSAELDTAKGQQSVTEVMAVSPSSAGLPDSPLEHAELQPHPHPHPHPPPPEYVR